MCLQAFNSGASLDRYPVGERENCSALCGHSWQDHQDHNRIFRPSLSFSWRVSMGMVSMEQRWNNAGKASESAMSRIWLKVGVESEGPQVEVTTLGTHTAVQISTDSQ